MRQRVPLLVPRAVTFNHPELCISPRLPGTTPEKQNRFPHNVIETGYREKPRKVKRGFAILETRAMGCLVTSCFICTYKCTTRTLKKGGKKRNDLCDPYVILSFGNSRELCCSCYFRSPCNALLASFLRPILYTFGNVP